MKDNIWKLTVALGLVLASPATINAQKTWKSLGSAQNPDQMKNVMTVRISALSEMPTSDYRDAKVSLWKARFAKFEDLLEEKKGCHVSPARLYASINQDLAVQTFKTAAQSLKQDDLLQQALNISLPVQATPENRVNEDAELEAALRMSLQNSGEKELPQESEDPFLQEALMMSWQNFSDVSAVNGNEVEDTELEAARQMSLQPISLSRAPMATRRARVVNATQQPVLRLPVVHTQTETMPSARAQVKFPRDLVRDHPLKTELPIAFAPMKNKLIELVNTQQHADVHGAFDAFYADNLDKLVNIADLLFPGNGDLNFSQIKDGIKRLLETRPDLLREYKYDDRGRNVAVSQEQMLRYLEQVYQDDMLEDKLERLCSHTYNLAVQMLASPSIDKEFGIHRLFDSLAENYLTGGGCLDGRRDRQFRDLVSMLASIML